MLMPYRDANCPKRASSSLQALSGTTNSRWSARPAFTKGHGVISKESPPLLEFVSVRVESPDKYAHGISSSRIVQYKSSISRSKEKVILSSSAPFRSSGM